MCRQKRVGEGNVHPGQKVGVGRAVRLAARSALVAAGNTLVQTINATGLASNGGVRTERRYGEPANRAAQATERILLVTRVLGNTGQRPRVQRLHQKRAHSPNQRAEVSVNLPGLVGRQVKPSGVTLGDYGEPGRCAIGSARE